MSRIDSGDVAMGGAILGGLLAFKVTDGEISTTVMGAGFALVAAGRVGEEFLD